MEDKEFKTLLRMVKNLDAEQRSRLRTALEKEGERRVRTITIELRESGPELRERSHGSFDRPIPHDFAGSI